ncbi:MAG: hypothetical protein AAF699_05240 [Pseudomonadota bacterium]
METEPEQPEQLARDTTQQDTVNIASIEKTFLRLTFWQTLLSLAGVFTGAVALYAALNESQAVRQQTAASVWPYVQYLVSDNKDGDTASFALQLSNVGVGPARMMGMQVFLYEESILDWHSLTQTLLEESVKLGVDYGKNSVSRRVLAPGESVIAFQTQHTALALKFQEAVYSGSLSLDYCYCSIFGDCWVVSSAQNDEDEPTRPVEVCDLSGFTD